jgi:glycine/D-amino acid oxidase-like deaminating enzyme
LGYGGNGITFSMLAAAMIARAVRGRPDVDAGLFAFE